MTQSKAYTKTIQKRNPSQMSHQQKTLKSQNMGYNKETRSKS